MYIKAEICIFQSEFTELKKERIAERQMLQRLFPTANVDDGLPYNQWISEMEICIESFINNLKTATTVVTEVPQSTDNSEVLKLQRQIQQNKESLDEYVSNTYLYSVGFYIRNNILGRFIKQIAKKSCGC